MNINIVESMALSVEQRKRLEKLGKVKYYINITDNPGFWSYWSRVPLVAVIQSQVPLAYTTFITYPICCVIKVLDGTIMVSLSCKVLTNYVVSA